jgi:hypothetical protein
MGWAERIKFPPDAELLRVEKLRRVDVVLGGDGKTEILA